MPIIQTDEFTEIRDEDGTLLARLVAYRWQCEADVCLRSSRDDASDTSPHYHPECLAREGND